MVASLVEQPDNGTVTVSSDGSFTYSPDDNFSGEDTFTYSASDGQVADTASVRITVVPAPPNTFTIDENSSVGTFIGQITPSRDLGDSPIFELQDPDVGNTLQLDRDTGELTVADSAALDFEVTPSFTFLP